MSILLFLNRSFPEQKPPFADSHLARGELCLSTIEEPLSVTEDYRLPLARGTPSTLVLHVTTRLLMTPHFPNSKSVRLLHHLYQFGVDTIYKMFMLPISERTREPGA
jgi:hypothetical protein